MPSERINIVYLDFANAFDNVNNKPLMEKLVKHRVGRSVVWINESITSKPHIVVPNGNKFLESEVLSGVPQGSVLVAIMFIIMVHNIYDKTKEAIAH